jgi:hypothetical protein
MPPGQCNYRKHVAFSPACAVCYKPKYRCIPPAWVQRIRLLRGRSMFARAGPSSFHADSVAFRLETVGKRGTALRFLLYPRDVGLGDGVPGRHVLLHTGGEAALLALGQRGAGLRHAALEAVLVEFLGHPVSLQAWMDSRAKSYLDKHAGVLHRGFLLDLAHDLRLGVAATGSAAERVHCDDLGVRLGVD